MNIAPTVFFLPHISQPSQPCLRPTTQKWFYKVEYPYIPPFLTLQQINCRQHILISQYRYYFGTVNLIV